MAGKHQQTGSYGRQAKQAGTVGRQATQAGQIGVAGGHGRQSEK
jgi:hypothetical protein